MAASTVPTARSCASSCRTSNGRTTRTCRTREAGKRALARALPLLLHVLDHRLAELARLEQGRPRHQALEVVRHALLRDGLLERPHDQIGGFGPPHVTQHHL